MLDHLEGLAELAALSHPTFSITLGSECPYRAGCAAGAGGRGLLAMPLRAHSDLEAQPEQLMRISYWPPMEGASQPQLMLLSQYLPDAAVEGSAASASQRVMLPRGN